MENSKPIKIVIKDKFSGEFYCVQKNHRTSEVEAGPNEFSFWSEDINDAHDFKSELLARHEFNMNDLTWDGTREPVILFFSIESFGFALDPINL